MTERHQRLCVWAGIGFAVVFGIGFVGISGFFPPPSPKLTMAEVDDLFVDDRDRIRVGIWVATAAAPLLAFYVAALTHQVGRISGRSSPLVIVQAVAGGCLILEFMFPQLVWQTAAFRAGRDPEIVLMLNDLAWLPFVGIVGTAMVQMVVLAISILQDDRRTPLLPRWSAYLNLWTAIGVAPGSFVVFTQEGPLAWNGLLAWYLLFLSFFVWMVTMTWLMLRASRRVEAEVSAAG